MSENTLEVDSEVRKLGISGSLQTTIPAEIRKQMGMTMGDCLKWSIRGGCAVLVLKKESREKLIREVKKID